VQTWVDDWNFLESDFRIDATFHGEETAKGKKYVFKIKFGSSFKDSIFNLHAFSIDYE
jgi:hypothetical protein